MDRLAFARAYKRVKHMTVHRFLQGALEVRRSCDSRTLVLVDHEYGVIAWYRGGTWTEWDGLGRLDVD